ncbi:hypothetical protein V6N13_111578 [Hibiscus sabdariffa]|uniref:BHLH domain-containing protein n=1 Tax=Hibiscus sabdariffa TaxID=183260 RepID=A0ABR2TKN4_9ROSI
MESYVHNGMDITVLERQANVVQNNNPIELYVLFRACCGKATDSHSLAERARREKISKKMSCLQDLVPGCNNITGKAGMLDEIINYVQSVQNKVEFLFMKLAALNPIVEFNVENLPMEEAKKKRPPHQ